MLSPLLHDLKLAPRQPSTKTGLQQLLLTDHHNGLGLSCRSQKCAAHSKHHRHVHHIALAPQLLNARLSGNTNMLPINAPAVRPAISDSCTIHRAARKVAQASQRRNSTTARARSAVIKRKKGIPLRQQSRAQPCIKEHASASRCGPCTAPTIEIGLVCVMNQ